MPIRSVHKRTVGAVQVFQEGIVEDGNDGPVFGAHRRMGQHDVVARVTAQRHALFAQLNLLLDLSVA